jgi:hypothetical protein
VTIFSKKRRSEMFGAQYLHRPIPGLSDFPAVHSIEYKLLGSVDEYRRKVYGDRAVKVSPEMLPEVQDAWDIRSAYYKAWALYADRIQNVEISPGWLGTVGPQFDKLVSSLPSPVLCHDESHKFNSESVWAIGDAPERGVFVPISVDRFTVLLNGHSDTGWYRASNVFGYQTVEWPAGRKPPIEGVAPVTKPISSDCDCFPNVVRVGRYGTWTKAVLVHTAFQIADKIR